MKVAPNSPEWGIIKAWNAERIAAWTAELSALDCPADRAHQLRGMIAALTEQIAHVEPRPTPEIAEPIYA